ncbi:MAG TPA: bifunctional riboflavin kinase/FAD synthetase [Bacteroidetes bacterium]|nr:bifunctional riboflavin kinase/FAD synthetase [Bacteroidota bacterium]
MKVYRSLEAYKSGKNPVATIGTYDGVHQGHRKILQRLIDAARAIDGESVVTSFHPHPRLVLYPEDNPLRLLHTLDERISAMEDMGIDKLLLIPFTRDFSRTTSHQFIEKILVQTVGIKRIIIGYDHHFGKNRTGGLKELRSGSAIYNYEVEEIPAAHIDNAAVSSTKIRKALLAGEVAIANRYLGYTYEVSGQVVEGEKLGRTIGYPTANVLPEDRYKLIPAEGVYLAQILVEGNIHYGMLNIGHKPTIGNFPLGLEINIFDFDQDLYGKRVTLRFLEWIREDLKFEGIEPLKAAIAQDKQACLALLAANKY